MDSPALRAARVKDASVGACGQSVVRAFISITYNQLAKLSLNVSSASLKLRSPSTLPCSVSTSSRSSLKAGSRNPSP